MKHVSKYTKEIMEKLNKQNKEAKMKINFSKILCLIDAHDWTCAADEGIKPTKQQIDDGTKGFYDYAKMYCKRCGYVYKPK